MSKIRYITRLGMKVTIRDRRDVEIVMSDDWADCVAHQAAELLEIHGNAPDEDGVQHHRQELRDLVDAINEGLR